MNDLKRITCKVTYKVSKTGAEHTVTGSHYNEKDAYADATWNIVEAIENGLIVIQAVTYKAEN
jgi:hypothetical protein